MNTEKGISDLERIYTDRICSCVISETNTAWTKFQADIINEIRSGGIRNFLQCATIQETMNYTPKKVEFNYLFKSPLWPWYKQIIAEDEIGNPLKLDYYNESSGNLVHHCYSFSRFLDFAKELFSIDNINTVYEVGGGYGSFCRLLINSGFKGKYVLQDVELMKFLQQFFLRCYNVIHFKSNPLYNIRAGTKLKIGNAVDVFFRTKPGGLNLLYVSEEIDLFIGLWSLSEIPVNDRDIYVELIKRSRFVLIGFQHFFEMNDNFLFFKEMIKRDRSKSYRLSRIRHIQDNYYLFGKPSDK